MPKKTGLTPAKKREAVLKLLRREEAASKIARRYGISEATLIRYRDAFLEGGLQALQDGKRDSAGARVKELEKELEQRDQVIGELTIANRILKKISDGQI
jgi:transposase-like protein